MQPCVLRSPSPGAPSLPANDLRSPDHPSLLPLLPPCRLAALPLLPPCLLPPCRPIFGHAETPGSHDRPATAGCASAAAGIRLPADAGRVPGASESGPGAGLRSRRAHAARTAVQHAGAGRRSGRGAGGALVDPGRRRTGGIRVPLAPQRRKLALAGMDSRAAAGRDGAGRRGPRRDALAGRRGAGARAVARAGADREQRAAHRDPRRGVRDAGGDVGPDPRRGARAGSLQQHAAPGRGFGAGREPQETPRLTSARRRSGCRGRRRPAAGSGGNGRPRRSDALGQPARSAAHVRAPGRMGSSGAVAHRRPARGGGRLPHGAGRAAAARAAGARNRRGTGAARTYERPAERTSRRCWAMPCSRRATWCWCSTRQARRPRVGSAG